MHFVKTIPERKEPMMKQSCMLAADILLPAREEIEKGAWAVIACDQFTSEPEYWAAAAEAVGDAPSTLQLMLPEVYLNETETRLPKIHAAMREALQSVLVCHPGSMIALSRIQSDGRERRGLVGMIDLEAYDYTKGSTALIRATEGTVLSRIPPRVAIRRDAPLELPHVMLLVDDPDHTVLDPLFDEQALIKDEVEYAIQINSKIKAKMMIPEGLSDEDIQATVCAYDEIAEQIAGKTVRKCIIVKGRLVNLIVG